MLKQHNRLLQHVKQGEMAEINTEVDEVGRQRLSQITSEYDHNDVYNMVETALFYRMQTDRTSKTLQESRSHNHPYILL